MKPRLLIVFLVLVLVLGLGLGPWYELDRSWTAGAGCGETSG